MKDKVKGIFCKAYGIVPWQFTLEFMWMFALMCWQKRNAYLTEK
jgi:hypothetical protein